MKKFALIAALVAPGLILCNCAKEHKSKFTGQDGEVKLITLDPGHFHAALIQKDMYAQISPDVHVYAPEGDDVRLHLERIARYNNRGENPTSWNEIVYTGNGFWGRFVADTAGNVVVLAGNNGHKTDYIKGAIEAGINVLADKPMAVDATNFRKLEEAFDNASRGGLLLYDMMTERFEITNVLQRELTLIPELFGKMERGSKDNPSIIKESVHHICKNVSGVPLTRPEWYFDTDQQGEGIVDVTTHLVDLVQLMVAGEQPIDYKKQIEISSARSWTTPVSLAQYCAVTGKNRFAEYLTDKIDDDTLRLACNGTINYALNDINCRVAVVWNYVAPEGGGDTHYSLVRGTRANIVIHQGAEQGFKPVIYIVSTGEMANVEFKDLVCKAVAHLGKRYPGIDTVPAGPGTWEITIPEEYNVGHESHFAQVTSKYLKYLVDGKIPDWEISQMKAKYYTTTQAQKIASTK